MVDLSLVPTKQFEKPPKWRKKRGSLASTSSIFNHVILEDFDLDDEKRMKKYPDFFWKERKGSRCKLDHSKRQKSEVV
jgi:hypothetical protein